ncbi:hypothetical protein V6N13_014349 [Hibiscus sabdariffa]
MAVEAPAKHVFDFDDEDEDGPIVFKRKNTLSSKQNRSNSEIKKASSKRSDGHSGSRASDVKASKVQSSNAQKDKAIPSSKSPPVRLPILSPKASASSAKTANFKTQASLNDQSKHTLKKNMCTVVKEEKSPIKGTTETDSDDDDDSPPLSARLKGISTQGNKGVSTSSNAQSHRLVPKTEVKGSTEDPDDEAPLSARFNMKSSTGTSSPKLSGSVETKPLASKTEQNGSTMKDKQEKSSMLSGKRPLDKGNSSDQSSAKKPKISDTPTAMKSKQVAMKAEKDDEDDDQIPISQRMKKSNPISKTSMKQKATKVVSSSLKKINNKSKKEFKNSKYIKSSKVSPSSGDGQKKWSTLVHNGVIFPPPYKPHGIKMLYEARPVDLTPEQEEVATMFSVMKDTDYMSKPQFKKNFWEDWSKLLWRNHIIKDLDKCDFTPIYEWHLQEKEKKKQMSSEEKKDLKEEKLKQEEKYMWAIVDGVKEKVGNFRVEPPGLFRGRGEHPKMGKLKRRIRPSDITINIGKDAPIPECPIPGESWKDIKHDNTVTCSLKGQSDKEKYEKARMLKEYIKNIRAAYTKDFTSKDVTKRQISVATYLIDKLALRAGNEKFDFLGKDSIQYVNTVEVELPVYKAIGQFQSGKCSGDNLFDKLDTSKLNAHLKELMPGLTAKVFRTYNASITLDEMVAIICNHQRSISKSHSAQMSRLIEKITELKGVLKELKIDLDRARKGKLPLKDADGKQKRNLTPEAIEKKIIQANTKIEKMERDMQTKEDLKTVALGTSKINYLDPRITVAWCKRHEVPIEKIFNKSLLAKFAWAMDVDPDFRF